jgi:hypothetical protein
LKASNSSWFAVLSLFGPILALPLSIVVGFAVAHVQGWNEFSFAVVLVCGMVGTGVSMLLGVLLAMVSIVRREPMRFFAWIATVMWPPLICFV